MASLVQYETGQLALFDHIEDSGPMWAGDGPRSVSSMVAFGSKFEAAPGVHVSIGSIDAASEQNLRLRIDAHDITPEGFTVTVHTWDDTRIGRLTLSWIAVGTAAPRDEGVWDV